VVKPISFVAGVDGRKVGAAVLKAGMVNPELRAQGPQLAGTVGYTDRTDVIPLRKEQFKGHLAVLHKFFRVGLNHHSFLSLGDAGRQQPSRTFYLDQTEPAGTDRGQPFEVAERRQFDTVLTTGLQQCCPRRSASLDSVYGHRDN
jgi:hypothetical protein